MGIYLFTENPEPVFLGGGSSIEVILLIKKKKCNHIFATFTNIHGVGVGVKLCQALWPM